MTDAVDLFRPRVHAAPAAIAVLVGATQALVATGAGVSVSRRIPVGKSHRTVPKHAFINRCFGQQVGMFALPHVRRKLRLDGMLFVDPTAGDADEPDTSPQLFMRHAHYLYVRGISVRGHLFEREPATFAQLRANLERAHYDPDITTLRQTDATMCVSQLDRRNLAVVYTDDPNTSHGSTLVPDIRDWLFSEPATTVIACIAANAGGVARLEGHYEQSLGRYLDLLDLAEREPYFRRLPAFVTIPKDPSRWGYMVISSDHFAKQMTESLTSIQKEFQGTVLVGFSEVRQALRDLHTPSRVLRERLQLRFDPGAI